MKKRGERRREQRYAVGFAVGLKTLRLVEDKKTLDGFVTDMSASGLRLLTKKRIEPGTRLRVSFTTASNQTSCEANVAWNRRRGKYAECGASIVKWDPALATGAVSPLLARAAPRLPRRLKR